MTNAFAETKSMFVMGTEYKKPMSYDDWMKTSDDLKAAVLFVQFYNQITLAWFKVCNEFCDDSDGVETILQYLCKNVEIIKNNPDRFNASYIYTVAYNCLASICIKGDRNKKIRELECVASNIPGYDEDHDVFDTVASVDCYVSSEKDSQSNLVWDLIESKDRDTAVVVAELIGDSMDWTRVSRSGKYRKFSKWDFAKITDERRAEIIADLRNDLQKLVDADMLDCIMVG